MAYKPKYAAKGPERKKPVPQPEETEIPPRKKSVLSVIFTVLLTLAIVPASIWITGKLMLRICENVGRPKAAAMSAVSDKTILKDFENHMDTVLQDIPGGQNASSQQVPGPEQGTEQKPPAEPTAPAETQKPQETKPIRKKYRLEDDVKVAPEPNPQYFGDTADPTSLQWLLDEAEDILEGQKLFFTPNVKLFEGSKVMYYLDDSIFAITWKEVHEGSVYTFSEVKVSDASQFRRHLAGGEFGSDMQYMTTEMAQSVNAVVASSGDFYRFRNFGICVYEGKVRRVEGTYAETCMIDRSGNMNFVRGGEITTTAAAQDYVDANDIWFSLCFGPILVDNYQVVEHSWYGVGEINEGYARAALCQMDDLHYIVATANTEGPNQDIPTVETFSKYISATGCRMAYCLDGGQTAAIVMNDKLINRPVYGTQRKISDIIFFATAVPEGG